MGSPRALLPLAALGGLFVAVFGQSCATAGPCQHNSDCDVGFYCNLGRGACVRNCVDAVRDCAPGEVCDVNGQCRSTDGGVPEASTDGSPDDAPVTTDGPPVVDTGIDVSVKDGGGPLEGELDLCASDAECKAGLLCRSLYQGGATRCTRTCTQSAQCWTPGRCVTINKDSYCVSADVGRTCDVNSPTACSYACVSPGYCTMPCTSGSDCPGGYGCATVSNQKVCVRAEQYCGQGATQSCTSLQCDTGVLVSSCTLPCTGASDCPQRASVLAKWTCQGGYCRRPADVYGPLAQGEPAEYACSGNTEVDLCNDAQHIDFDKFTIPSPPSLTCPVGSSVSGVQGDACVDTCRFTGACAFGYACTSVGNLSNARVGLCLPSNGGGEVGDACTKDRDCAFGYCSQNKCSRDCSADGLCPTGSACTAVGGNYPNVEGIPFKRCQ